MKKIKEFLNFLVDKKTLSYVVPFYFSITLSVIYMVLCYMIITYNFRHELENSDNIFQMISENFYTIFAFIWILIWLYFILKKRYKFEEYNFKKFIEKRDITKIKSQLIFFYWTWLYCFFLFLCLTIWTFFKFYYFSWCLFSWTTLWYNIIILWLSLILFIIELIKFKDNKQLRNLSLLTILLIISYIIFYALIVSWIFVLILFL